MSIVRVLSLSFVGVVVRAATGCAPVRSGVGTEVTGVAMMNGQIGSWHGIPLSDQAPARPDHVSLTPAQWQAKLKPEAYNILREAGTEAPFSGSLLHVDQPGTFVCAGCGLELFTTEDKFDSGTGWPSFVKPIVQKNVYLKVDNSLFDTRYEVRCSRCEGHLGHVFDDGPADRGGLRYCMNSAALEFKAKGK